MMIKIDFENDIRVHTVSSEAGLLKNDIVDVLKSNCKFRAWIFCLRWSYDVSEARNRIKKNAAKLTLCMICRKPRYPSAADGK